MALTGFERSSKDRSCSWCGTPGSCPGLHHWAHKKLQVQNPNTSLPSSPSDACPWLQDTCRPGSSGCMSTSCLLPYRHDKLSRVRSFSYGLLYTSNSLTSPPKHRQNQETAMDMPMADQTAQVLSRWEGLQVTAICCDHVQVVTVISE